MTTTYYIINVEAAIYKDGRWLIIERGSAESHAPGLLSLVGGTVDGPIPDDQILEQTLVREVDEEIGLTVTGDLDYVQSSAFMSDDHFPVIDIVFLCRSFSGTAHCRAPDEVAAIHWLHLDEVLSHPKAPPWLRQSLLNAEAKRHQLERLP